ncbi:MAG TPA: energy transducer TonB [Thermoanaerobaculia bacterium]
MFESVAPDVARIRQGRALYRKTLPVSLLAHALAFGAVPISTMWNITFPTQSPGMMMSYSLVEPPPLPPPPPPPPAAPKAVQVAEVKIDQLPPMTQLLAPTVIPDTIPDVTQVPVEGNYEGGQGSGVEGGIPGGVPGGVVGGTEDGITGGDVGGKDDGVVGGVDDGRVVVPRDATLRMHALSKTFPIYPERARISNWEDRLVVRYVIGTNGRIKEVTVLDPATRKIFDEAAVNAIRFWRFRPMIKDGKPVEVEHELTVYFKLNV